MPVSLPNPLTDGTTAFGSHVKANDDALAGKFTEGANGIADADIKIGAAIKGTKLSNVANDRIPTDRLEDDSITDAKLRDANDGGDANRAVTSDHIRIGAVTASKLASDAVTRSKLKVTETVVTIAAGAGNINPANARAFDLSVAGPVGGVTVTNPILYSTHRPIACLQQAAGVFTLYATAPQMVPRLHRDTAADKVMLVIHNIHPSLPFSIEGSTWLVLSVPSS